MKHKQTSKIVIQTQRLYLNHQQYAWFHGHVMRVRNIDQELIDTCMKWYQKEGLSWRSLDAFSTGT